MIAFEPEALWQHLAFLLKQCGADKSPKIVVGFSGGLDSTVLLQSLHSLNLSQSNFQLKAIHINHQLQSSADAWAVWCAEFCKKNQITFQCVNVDAKPKPKESPEAAARRARYHSLNKLLADDEILVTAHHQDDQVETTLLQMLRGTGVTGAAGMKAVSSLQDMTIVRPLLNYTRSKLHSYAQAQKLDWIDDPSNACDDYDRNYLRLNILPLLAQRWPAYPQTISRFAHNAREASELMEEIAKQDYADAYIENHTTLNIDVIKSLTEIRQKNLIRFWISNAGYLLPNLKHLSQIITMLHARLDAKSQVRWANAEIRRFKHELYLLKQIDDFDAKTYHWDGVSDLQISHIGIVQSTETLGRGLKKSMLKGKIAIRFRLGGEKCRPAGRKETHSLKKLFQDYQIPPWQRERMPILFVNDEIAAVLGLFYCEPFAAESNEASVEIEIKSPE